jgi:2-oxoisovalerate dehydrogenase E1 component
VSAVVPGSAAPAETAIAEPPAGDGPYRSDRRPLFAPFVEDCGSFPGFAFAGDVRSELAAGRLSVEAAIALLEDMLTIRELEEMIVRLRSGGYDVLPGFDYRGPTHVSIGQEATSVGACAALRPDDRITSSHRGHGDAIAKGFAAIRTMTDDDLAARVPGSAPLADHDARLEGALEEHVFRTMAELFGKEEGYCRGRGGGMHIADFSTGHLGANAIVGGSVPIATGAAMTTRYLGSDRVVLCMVGDGAFANGVVLESLNWATQAQWTNFLAGDRPFGLPVIYLIQNNHYGMTHRTDDEVMGVTHLARRGAGFSLSGMHAEVVNGMDVLAVRDAIRRAAERCRAGEGPVLIEASTYRYYGHSLSDPRNEYRTREEEAAWRAVDPIETLKAELLDGNLVDEAGLDAVASRVRDRNARAARRAAAATDPPGTDVLRFLYTDTTVSVVPVEFRDSVVHAPPPSPKLVDGEMTYRDALREALAEEMTRDRRVILYGEDVADYGGAFKLTKGLLETFGRERVFNTPISEACICGTAVGAAMTGLRPVVELMYMDFALMASDQIANQAAKWHYMSGAQAEVPLVIRASVGAGKGYGGQHSQSLESLFTHLPGIYVVYPATPADAKGLLKSAIRDNNPVLFVESQSLYGSRGIVPDGPDVTVPIGQARIAREGADLTIVAWGPAVPDALAAAATLSTAHGVEAEVVDIRSLVPLDLETILGSVRKTGRCVVASHAILAGSFVNEIVARILEAAFDDLDAPIARVGAQNGISPQAEALERAFLPTPDDILTAALGLI